MVMCGACAAQPCVYVYQLAHDTTGKAFEYELDERGRLVQTMETATTISKFPYSTLAHEAAARVQRGWQRYIRR